MHLLGIDRHFEFGGYFGSYINYYKSETFLMPNKTFVDNFIGLFQENILCMFKKIFVKYIAAFLELAVIATLKGKSEMETYNHYLVNIYKGF